MACGYGAGFVGAVHVDEDDFVETVEGIEHLVEMFGGVIGVEDRRYAGR